MLIRIVVFFLLRLNRTRREETTLQFPNPYMLLHNDMKMRYGLRRVKKNSLFSKKNVKFNDWKKNVRRIVLLKNVFKKFVRFIDKILVTRYLLVVI